MSSLTFPKAIFFAAIIIAASIVFGTLSQVSGQTSNNGYMIAGDGSQFIWRVNTATGAVSYCVRRDNSSDPALIARRPPYCSAESPAVR